MSSDKKNDIILQEQHSEFDMVEESFKDFIKRVDEVVTKIINYYEQYHISNIVHEKYEQRLYDADTLIEAFEVLKEMFETLMSEIISARPPQAERVNFLELGLESQSELANIEELVKKYQVEIRTLHKAQQEAVKVTVDTAKSLDEANTQIQKLNETIKVYSDLIRNSRQRIQVYLLGTLTYLTTLQI